ncbi:MAG: DpnI domain-containing protein [Gammaproteobacteria bacterium]
MRTAKQQLGDFGEELIRKKFNCPKCKRAKTLKKLPPNFKCADLVCDFCGYLAQVKTHNVKDINKFPKMILGAAWGPQKERMDAGIYFPLYVVLKSEKKYSVFYRSSDTTNRLGKCSVNQKTIIEVAAERAGSQGYYYDGAMMKACNY